MNQLPAEVIGHIFDFLDSERLYSLLKEFPGFVSKCCAHVRFKLMYSYISDLEFDFNHQAPFKSKRKKPTWIRGRHFQRGKTHVEHSITYTPRQTLMIYYPQKSLKVLFNKVGPYLLSKINNWNVGKEKEEKIIKQFYSHFYKMKISMKRFKYVHTEEGRFTTSNKFENCLELMKNYSNRLSNFNKHIATEYLGKSRENFYIEYIKLVNQKKVDIQFFNDWNEKFKATRNILSYSKMDENSKKAIAVIISTIWNEHDNLLDLLPLLRGLDVSSSKQRTDASRVLLEVIARSKEININTAQDLKRIQNLIECCSIFKYSINEFKNLLQRFFAVPIVSSEMQEQFNSWSLSILNKYP